MHANCRLLQISSTCVYGHWFFSLNFVRGYMLFQFLNPMSVSMSGVLISRCSF